MLKNIIKNNKGSNVTIRQKLMMIIMLISTISLLITAILFTLFQAREIRNGMVSELTTLANFIGSNSNAALAFNDPIDANEILKDLIDNPMITHAVIYNSDGDLFASYKHSSISDLHQHVAPEYKGFEFRDNRLAVHQIIEDANGVLGSTYLEASTDKIFSQIEQNIQITLGIIIFGLIICYFLTTGLQKLISTPIYELSTVANKIKESQDYNIRITRNDYKEIEHLCDSFNSMLENIQDRENSLRQLASYDPLTELPNRKYFIDLLTRAIKRGKRHSHKHAILFLDLDRFKNINDSLGHTAGDELLVATARRLQVMLRGDDTVARLGGDEYTILLQELISAHQAAEIGARVLEVLTEPFHIQGHHVVISPSIGIVIYPDHGQSPEELIKNADTAMYQAKHSGGNNYRFFSEEMNVMAKKRQHLEEALRQAFKNDEIILNYQPQLDLKNGYIIGIEALCRWHRENIIVPPNDFIPIAEETGLIVPMTDIILTKVLIATKFLVDDCQYQHNISVNVAARHFQQANFIKTVEIMLQESGVDPERLEIEITEAAVMQNTERSINTLSKIKELGITISIDDFGTGYSSLSYLSNFPIDKLKIDKSFINNMQESNTNMNIVRSIIELGHNLNLKVVAEGVETYNQMKILQNLDCDIMQGFYFSNPVNIETIGIYLSKETNLFQPDEWPSEMIK